MSDKLTEKTVQLDTPIMRGKTQITEIVLRKPQSGALRGTRLQAIMDMDVGAMMTVIPRISTPTLTAQEMAELDPGRSHRAVGRGGDFFVEEVGACRFTRQPDD
ncbi:tail E family protein [Escherichia coli]|nr:tail E family protein [Escherichia coli]